MTRDEAEEQAWIHQRNVLRDTPAFKKLQKIVKATFLDSLLGLVLEGYKAGLKRGREIERDDSLQP